jgi:FkbM family methyltransferase
MSFLIDYLRPGDVFGDFGANVGVYSVLAGSVGARVLSVEPLPETFSRLQENLRLNEVEGRAVRCGLSSSSGTLRFTKARGGLNRVATTTDEDVIDVTVLTLDDLTLETGLVPQLIKIDVEGFELPLLQGGVRSLRSAVAIIIELNGSGRVYGHTDEQVQDFLLHAGFECFDYRPETRELIERKGARRDKLNSIFLNRDFIADVRSRIAPFG